MKSITCAISAVTLAVVGCGAATAADAAITINITNTAAGVLVQGSGSFNTTGLVGTAPVGSAATGLNGETAVVRFGTGFSQGSYNIFALSGPTSFGSASPYWVASTAVGDAFGLVGSLNQLLLPSLYVSGTALTGTLTFLSQTINGLGLTAGTYNYTAGVDTLTVNIEGEAPPPPVAAVPEPATWGMMILGFGVIGASMRRRKSTFQINVRFA